MSCEEQREEEIQRAPENIPERGHQQRESELQRIRESRGSKSCFIWVSSYAKALFTVRY